MNIGIFIVVLIIILLIVGAILKDFIDSLENSKSFSINKMYDNFSKHKLKGLISAISGADIIVYIVISSTVTLQRFINNFIWRLLHSKNYINFTSTTLNGVDYFLLSILSLIVVILLSYWLFIKEPFRIYQICMCILFYLLLLNFLNVFTNMFHHTITILIILVVCLILYLFVFPKIVKYINKCKW